MDEEEDDGDYDPKDGEGDEDAAEGFPERGRVSTRGWRLWRFRQNAGVLPLRFASLAQGQNDTFLSLGNQILASCCFAGGFDVGWLGVDDGFYGDAADAAAGHLGYRVAAASVGDAFAGGGDVADVGEEEAGEGFDACFSGEGPVELRAEVSEGCAAVDGHDAGGAKEGRAGDVELVVKLADDLLEDVFGGDDADGGTELVDGDGDVAAALLEFLEELDG